MITPDQRKALAMVLGHYGTDPRTRPLHELREQCDTTSQALFQAQEAAKELLQKLQRLEAAMQWIEDHARAGKIEIAPSVRGTGFEFGFWPQGRALVITGAPTLLDALDVALGPNE